MSLSFNNSIQSFMFLSPAGSKSSNVKIQTFSSSFLTCISSAILNSLIRFFTGNMRMNHERQKTLKIPQIAKPILKLKHTKTIIFNVPLSLKTNNFKISNKKHITTYIINTIISIVIII